MLFIAVWLKIQVATLASLRFLAYQGEMTDTATLSAFTDALLDAVAAGELVKLTLSKPTATAEELKSITVRPILVKRVLKLSFTYQHRTRDIVKNYPPQEASEIIAAQLAEHFRAAQLCTMQADVRLAHGHGGYHLSRHAPTQTDAPELSHDRTKTRLIESANAPYLHALGITDAKGNVYKNAQDKFRQINKYIEILDGLLKQLPPRETVRVVDMGAGKGYLTFALYDYLTHHLKRPAEVVGVEFRADLVAQCNAIARAAGFAGLRFVEGSIAAYDCAGADVVIALHACDTATDDALAKAIHVKAALIVVAPCCHKQIRRGMGKVAPNHPLAPMLRYGTYVERMSEMLTDTLRAQWMEVHGYRTNLFEFISDAHTPKNVMIVATQQPAPIKDKDAALLRAAIACSKAEFGIAEHYLERLLGEV